MGRALTAAYSNAPLWRRDGDGAGEMEDIMEQEAWEVPRAVPVEVVATVTGGLESPMGVVTSVREGATSASLPTETGTAGRE
jgi:hypothetical protein